MICRTTLAVGLAAVGVGLAGAGAAHAQPMPGTFLQCLGYGCGAGYHAPIVRTPWQEPMRGQRMKFAPQCCGPLGPAPYMVTGCSGACATGGCEYIPRTGPTPQVPEPPVPKPAEGEALRDYRIAAQYRWP